MLACLRVFHCLLFISFDKTAESPVALGFLVLLAKPTAFFLAQSLELVGIKRVIQAKLRLIGIVVIIIRFWRLGLGSRKFGFRRPA
jgi:hypothetical protein